MVHQKKLISLPIKTDMIEWSCTTWIAMMKLSLSIERLFVLYDSQMRNAQKSD